MATTHTTDRVTDRDREIEQLQRAYGRVSERRASVSWSGILSGAAVGLAVLYVFQSFWAALGFGSGIDFFADNLDWWGFASAILAATTGGLVAGFASGRRGPILGMISGLTVWGIVLVAASAFGLSAAVQVVVGGAEGAEQLGLDSVEWAAFASIFGGFVITGIFGMIGSAIAPKNREEIDIR